MSLFYIDKANKTPKYQERPCNKSVSMRSKIFKKLGRRLHPLQSEIFKKLGRRLHPLKRKGITPQPE